MRFIITMLIFPLSLFAQKIEFQKSDTLYCRSSSYPTYTLRINNYSASDPAMVFVVSKKNLNTFKRLIPKYYFSRKQEYNEYYLLGVPKVSQTETVKSAVTAFLNKIDSSRMVRNRSTFRRVYTFDQVSGVLTYQSTFRNLSQVDNLYYLKSVKDICHYMVCPGSIQLAD